MTVVVTAGVLTDEANNGNLVSNTITLESYQTPPDVVIRCVAKQRSLASRWVSLRFAAGRGFHRCARCKCVKYCSEECQRTHWRTHKASCMAASGS